MIKLTRLNNQSLMINSDLIKWIESAPDTVLTLVNGEKVIVRESAEQILEGIVEFRRRLLHGLPEVLANQVATKGGPSEGASARGPASGS